MAKLGEVCKVSPSTKNIERQGAWLLNLDRSQIMRRLLVQDVRNLAGKQQTTDHQKDKYLFHKHSC